MGLLGNVFALTVWARSGLRSTPVTYFQAICVADSLVLLMHALESLHNVHVPGVCQLVHVLFMAVQCFAIFLVLGLTVQRCVRVVLGGVGRPSCPWVLDVLAEVGPCFSWRGGPSFMSLSPKCPWRDGSLLFLEGWAVLHVLGSLMSLQRWVLVVLGEMGRPSCPWVLNVRGEMGPCSWRDGSSFMSLGP